MCSSTIRYIRLLIISPELNRATSHFGLHPFYMQHNIYANGSKSELLVRLCATSNKYLLDFPFEGSNNTYITMPCNFLRGNGPLFSTGNCYVSNVVLCSLGVLSASTSVSILFKICAAFSGIDSLICFDASVIKV